MTNSRRKGAVAAGHRLTAGTAANVLSEGGHAADAAIAALAMACVCEPVLASPGGGGFAMTRDAASGRAALIDFFPHTPLKRRGDTGRGVREILADFGTATQAFHIGPATTATPGFFAGIEAIHAHGAGAPLAELFAPAVKAAREGVSVTPYQHYLATVVRPILVATAEARALFAPRGDVTGIGEISHNPGLADAFEVMAADGFAAGPVGREIVSGQRGRGHLTAQDLEAYQAVVRKPLAVMAGGDRVFLNPPPAASGTLIAYALGRLEATDGTAFARALSDTDRARRNANGDVAWLLDRPVRQRGTTHISVIDANGNACAVTVSNGEGNGELAGPFGFMPNNILGEEDVNPHGDDGWPENTRLASMMCPAIIETGKGGLIALGSGGSNRIRSAILQVIARLALDGAGLKEAIDAPRLHVENGHMDFENLFDEKTRMALTKEFSDHRSWPEPNMFFGGAHAVEMSADGGFSGAGDNRRDGVSIVVE